MTRISLVIFVLLTLFCVEKIRADENDFPSYLELGITFSSLVHPSIGYWSGRKGVRFSGIYLDEDKREYHLNLGYVLSDADNVQRSINFLTSRVVGSDPGADYDFASSGIAYGINYNGFFFELGLAIPWKDEIGNLKNDPVIPCGYLGYIHRFRLP